MWYGMLDQNIPFWSSLWPLGPCPRMLDPQGSSLVFLSLELLFIDPDLYGLALSLHIRVLAYAAGLMFEWDPAQKKVFFLYPPRWNVSFDIVSPSPSNIPPPVGRIPGLRILPPTAIHLALPGPRGSSHFGLLLGRRITPRKFWELSHAHSPRPVFRVQGLGFRV